MLTQDHTTRTLSHEQRFPELDSLRGLAAMMVVLVHFHDMWSDGWSKPHGVPMRIAYLVLQAIHNGRAPVLLFFVLSGFVLALPLLRGKHQPYLVYAVRRILRIAGPYLCALLLACIGDLLLWQRPHPLMWSKQMWTQPLDARLILQHVLFLGVFDYRQVNFVIWTLVQEMRISLIFPLIFAIVARLRSASLLVAAAIFSCFAWLIGNTDLQPRYARSSFAQTLLYIAFFIAGILLAMNLDRVRSGWLNLSARSRFFFASASLMAYLYGITIIGIVAGVYHAPWFTSVQQWTLGAMLTMFGAVGCIIIALHAKYARAFLLTRPLRFLGRISYSLYLVHPIVLLSISLLLFQHLSPWGQLPLYLVSAIAFAWIFCLFAEEPFIRLSRKAPALLRRVGFTA